MAYLYLIALVLGMCAAYCAVIALIVAVFAGRSRRSLGFLRVTRLAFLGLYPGLAITFAAYAINTNIMGRPVGETSPFPILGGLGLAIWMVRRNLKKALAVEEIFD